jgi:preprotein translocase subunit YajC
MNLIDLLFLAQAASPAPDVPQPSFLVSMMPLIFIVVIFYFLLIRPQQKRQKAHQQLVASIKTGDKIVTSSGIHGIVANVKEKTILVKVADNVKIEFDRSSVAGVEKGAEVAEEVK